MRDRSPVVVEQTYNADVATVWRAITDPSQMAQWYFEPIERFEPVVGFETSFTIRFQDTDWVHLWRVTDVVPMERIAYTFNFENCDGEGLVTWVLTPVEGATKLTLTHTGLETFTDDGPAFEREQCLAGWTYFITESLKEFVETSS
ncbi:MAG: SRPBCC domain-containing protein [Phycisphaerales bacterium JB043]